MTLPALLAHVAARWAATRTPTCGWVPDESETDMTEHLHHITHTHDAGYGIRTEFTCTGDRTSPCHQYPPDDAEMDRWSAEDGHLFVSHERCWFTFWMDDADCDESCGPDGEPVRSGPINVTWGGDCAEWEYAEPAVTPGDVHQARADADRARSDAAWDLYRDRQGGA